MKCAVGNCRQNDSGKSSASFYSFPKKDKGLKRLWIKFCNRRDTIKTHRERICSLHFKQDDFERNLKFEMGFSNRATLKLKEGAVPTIKEGETEEETTIFVEEATTSEEETKTIFVKEETTSEDETKTIFIEEATTSEEETKTFVEETKKFVEETTKFPKKRTTAKTSTNQDSLQIYIKNMKDKMDALRNENDMLKIQKKQTEIKMKKLSQEVRKLKFKKANLQKALRRIFTKGQIKKLINGDKRQNFTEEDIAQSITLYSTSAKAYRLLKRKNFPLPSVRTLQRWSKKSDVSTGILDPDATSPTCEEE